jgi:hypothetical protein
VAIFGLLETLQKSNPRSLNSVLRLAEQKHRETSRALIESNESKAPPIDSILGKYFYVSPEFIRVDPCLSVVSLSNSP